MIDVNGTRYHLLLGRDGWMESESDDGPRRWEYDDGREAVRLQAEIYTFAQRGPAAVALTPEERRGADRDSYGHWYWIGEDETEIWARWAEAAVPVRLFPAEGAACLPPRRGAFHAATPAAASAPERLVGLAVVADGYLVVGAPASGSLLVFDLYALDGGFVRVPLPPAGPGTATEPFDLAALPDGGLLVLDRAHRLLWHLDRAFRPVPVQPAEAGDTQLFQPKEGEERHEQVTPPATPLDLSDTNDPIAVEPLPGGSCWILDHPGAEGSSSLWLYPLDGSLAAESVLLTTANLVEAGSDDLDLGQIRGHDLAYMPDRPAEGPDPERGILFIADEAGNQAFGLRVDLSAGLQLRITRQYFPLRSFAGSALVAVWSSGEVYYQQASRWLPVKALPQMKYEVEGVLVLPVFDGRDPGCVWHRLCLDACIPPETAVSVQTRAADVADELQWQAWVTQPAPYLRPAGSEIPYASLWREADLEKENTGTWELLFQETSGRYLEVRLTLAGNGRSTPLLRALRAHYPRFSYLRHYLPDVYQQDENSLHFVENFLANPEGMLTTVEGMIAQVQFMLDVRTAPTPAVDWLAGWVGLALEPGWSDYQRRLLLAHAPGFFRRRGTLPGLMQAILLTVKPELGPAIFQDDIDDYCATIRIVERFLTRTRPGVYAGDPTEAGLATAADVLQDAAARAHTFTVMLPTTIDQPTQRLVERIIELEKPAHTSYTIKQYWALFRVGEVRLGYDTVLGQGGRFETYRLGQTALAEGVLGAAFPHTLDNRTVLAH